MSLGMHSGYSNVTSMLSRGPNTYLGGNKNKHRAFAKAESYGVRIRKSNLPAALQNPKQPSLVSTNVSTRPNKLDSKTNGPDVSERVFSLETETYNEYDMPFKLEQAQLDTRNSIHSAAMYDHQAQTQLRQKTYLGKRP